MSALHVIFLFGYAYQEVGNSGWGRSSGPDERVKTQDRMNARQGRGRQQWMSPRYTIQWKEMITVT